MQQGALLHQEASHRVVNRRLALFTAALSAASLCKIKSNDKGDIYLICRAFMMQMCKRDLIEMTEYIFNVIGNQHSVAVSNQQACVLHCANKKNNDYTL